MKLMKTKSLLAALLALPLLAGVARATLVEYNSDPALNAAIPDGSSVGLVESATLSGIPEANSGAVIQNVDVNLNISGGYNGDLYGYLVLQSADHSTTTAILLNRVGTTASDAFGADGSGFNVTLTGGGTVNLGDIHTAAETTGSQLTGVYLADGRTDSPLTVTDTSARTAALDAFNGADANGTWTLFLADLSTGGGQATLNSWGVNVSVVPEPITWALIIFAALLGARGLVVCRQRRSATL
jgi:subtilisin-like proprotein convertase family protein